MRIIGGRLSGQQFQSPSGHRTHPMSDKVRGGLFNSLGDVVGLSLLDAFSGSGAVSYEAISRGAESAVAVEIDRKAHQTIQANLDKLGLKHEVKASQAPLNKWLSRNQDQKFDLIVADPPYDDLQINNVNSLGKHLKPNGTLVLSWPGKLDRLELEGLKCVHSKNYGDSQLVFYKEIQ